MTRRAPQDSGLNRLIQTEIRGPNPTERMLFVDTDDQLREVVYANEFDNGILGLIRTRLVESGVLKAVLHLCAKTVSPGTHGSFVSVLEYLPNGRRYAIMNKAHLEWESGSGHKDIMDRSKKLFESSEEENKEES